MAIPPPLVATACLASAPRTLAHSSQPNLRSTATASSQHSTSQQEHIQRLMLFADRFRAPRPLSEALYGPVGLYEDAQRGDELVAIKQVSLTRAMAALRRSRNVDNPWSEHRVVARLMTLPPHPNVVRFRGEFLHAQDTWCVVMEFCPGGDLWDVLEAAPKYRLLEREALQLFAQCVSGVRFLHAHGIAHRDLSLENVFYCRGACKIGDFGLSTDEPLRGRGEAVGKAYYMAPEVVNQEAYDAFAADMWSLGIMLFIMLTGRQGSRKIN